MKIAIIEDEIPALKRITKMIAEVAPEADIIGTADSIEAAVELFRTHNDIQLVLMDIELADGQSFEIFKQVEVTCPVIFTTAYDEFALKAFKVNSIDYLLKPIDKNELKEAILKFKKLHDAPPKTNYEEQFRLLIHELKGEKQESYKNRFLLKSGTKYISIAASDIAYCYVHDKLVYLVQRKGTKHILDYSLDELSRMLDPRHFFQMNRQVIASYESIQSIHSYFNGKLKIELQPILDEEVIVSREKAAEFKEWLDGN
jgi:two-component system response regulator LytT